MLEIRDLKVMFGKSIAINNVNLDVPQGGIVTLIGSNGAGKSTTLNAALGVVPTTEGSVKFMSEDITNLSISEKVQRGLVLVPEGRHLFPYLSVYKNLILGATQRKDREGILKDLEFVYELFPILKERAKQKAGTLSGGQQQMVAIARGIMAAPKLLCLDEPSLGLAPAVIEDIGKKIRELNRVRGTSILLVEQNVHLAFGVADYCYTLQVGNVVAEGKVDEIRQNDTVRKAYFGG
ncbi:MAG: ABC transporter ATP-binding protein [Oscillospiraceae bacterium]|nr:ABC transporter ATP-binding protein [Oscillospiraceae bacterium]